jgi:hypothetical protein
VRKAHHKELANFLPAEKAGLSNQVLVSYTQSLIVD